MPRPVLLGQQKSNLNSRTDSLLSVSAVQKSEQKTQRVEKMKLDRILREPRSKEYMAAMSKLDAGGHVCNQAQVDEMVNTINNEFPEIVVSGIMLGIVSECFLGKPYEVHTLDIGGSIITHYKAGQTLPGGLEKARSLALRGGYAFIEVYVDCCRAISSNGSVSVVPC